MRRRHCSELRRRRVRWSAKRRAPRLHANAGSRSARNQPLDVQPARTANDRHSRDAVGHTVDSSRRTAAVARRAATTGSNASTVPRDARTPRRGRDRRRRPHPNRTRSRQQPGQDRARAHRRPDTNGTRRRAVVAIDGTSRTAPIRNLTPRKTDTRCPKRTPADHGAQPTEIAALEINPTRRVLPSPERSG